VFSNGLKFDNVSDLIAAFNDDRVSEEQLKTMLTGFLNEVLGKVQSDSESAEVREILSKAYAAEASSDSVEMPKEKIPELDDDGKALLNKLRGDLEVSVFHILLKSSLLVSRFSSFASANKFETTSASGLAYLRERSIASWSFDSIA
jgi:hypothetical protein